MAGSSKKRVPCPSSPIVANSASLAFLWLRYQPSMLAWWGSETRMRGLEELIQADEGDAGTIERAMAAAILVIDDIDNANQPRLVTQEEMVSQCLFSLKNTERSFPSGIFSHVLQVTGDKTGRSTQKS